MGRTAGRQVSVDRTGRYALAVATWDPEVHRAPVRSGSTGNARVGVALAGRQRSGIPWPGGGSDGRSSRSAPQRRGRPTQRGVTADGSRPSSRRPSARRASAVAGMRSGSVRNRVGARSSRGRRGVRGEPPPVVYPAWALVASATSAGNTPALADASSAKGSAKHRPERPHAAPRRVSPRDPRWLVSVNPTSGLELPADRGRRDRFATPTEAAALIAALDPGDRAAWALALYAGLRLGEIRALGRGRHRPRCGRASRPPCLV